MRHQGAVNSLVFSPDGQMLASAGADQTIILWDVASQLPLGKPLKAHTSSVESLAFSPDGKFLASAGSNGTVFLWDVDLKSWQARAKGVASRPLSEDEWRQYLPDESYRSTFR